MSQPRLDLLAKAALGLASLVSLALLTGLIGLAQMARGPEGGRVPELLGLPAASPLETESQADERGAQLLEKATDGDPHSSSEDGNAEESFGEPEFPDSVTAQAPSTEEPIAPATAEEPEDKPKRRKATRKRAKTSRESSTPIEPPTEDATPERPPEASFRLLPRAITDRATPGRKTLFEVGMDPASDSKATRVHMKMQCKPDKSRWRRYTMKRTGRKLWSAEINFRIEDRGSCRYYFTAREAAAAPEVSLGSRSAPYKVRVRQRPRQQQLGVGDPESPILEGDMDRLG